MAKPKKMSNREKKERAECKKYLQKEGILPPDKPKLNRKTFMEEVMMEWGSRAEDCYIWDIYIMEAISYILAQKEGRSQRVSLEAVGAAKILKLAMRLREFSDMVKSKGEQEYKIMDQYNYVKDILDA